MNRRQKYKSTIHDLAIFDEEHFFAKNYPLEILLFEFISSLNSEIKIFEMDILSNFAHQKTLFVAFSSSPSI